MAAHGAGWADQLAAISADIVAGIIGAFRNGEAPSPARASGAT
ncbi:MAG: hypothetical protein WDN04_18470 [Rhodospirillales bacterium]